MSTTIDKFAEGFPYPTVTPITGLPNYETIADLHEQLNDNSSFVQSNLGGGAYGHLALTVTPAVFTTLAPTMPYIIPVNPGANPVIPEGSTGPQIASIRLTHDNATNFFYQTWQHR